MDQLGNSLNNLEIGMKVEINPQQDKSRTKLISGIISKVLTQSSHHPHGILVELENGEIGRVKKIIGSKTSPDKLPKFDDSLPSNFNDDIASVISNGENHFVEFKSSILWSNTFSYEQIKKSNSLELKQYGQSASKFIIAKSIAGFLNADGGHLLIGIKENKSSQKDEIIGIESEFFKLRDQCIDGYRRMIVDQVIKDFLPLSIFHHINNYLQINFLVIGDKTICHIRINKSDSKVFVKHKKMDLFFVRIDATTREIRGEEMVNYCLKRFK